MASRGWLRLSLGLAVVLALVLVSGTLAQEKPPEVTDDYGVVHTFPEGREVCTFGNTICFYSL